MIAPVCIMVVMSDGSGLTVKVLGDKVMVDVCEVHHYFETEFKGPLIEVFEKVFIQEFDFSGLPWRSERHQELLAELVRDKITRASFKSFAEPIVKLAQKLVAQKDKYSRSEVA